MAVITYQVLQKPIDERIIDAACIYWDVERSYFFQKFVDSTIAYRKGIIYYLIHKNTTYSYEYMAKKFGFLSHQPVKRLVENLESTKDVYKQHSNDLNQIQHLAERLDASFIQTEVRLINKVNTEELEVLPDEIKQGGMIVNRRRKIEPESESQTSLFSATK